VGDHASALFRILKRTELPILLLIGLLLAGLWAMAEIVDEVREGDTVAFDEALLLAMRNPADLADPVGPPWLEEMMRDFTGLGGVAVLALLTAFAIVYLLLMERRRAALLVLIAVGGGMLLSSLSKAGFDRPRPDLVPHGSYVYTASFPSGHSMMSAVTYLTLGALLARTHARRRVKLFFLSTAVTVTLLIGVSRVYLGVHWPTDVLTGWAAGAVWAILCWLAALWFQQRGTLEPSVDTRT
jgi:undecaprenyl-diphosphatase